MSMETARVVEAGLRSFQCAYEGYAEEPFQLGQFVVVREGRGAVLGVVADVASGPDDPSRPLQPRGKPSQTAAEVLADNPDLRLLLRTRVTAVSCGQVEGEATRALLPATPPPLLARVEPAGPAEIVRLADDGSFLALLLASPLCDDAVITAAVRGAMAASGAGQRELAVRAGKELARLLKAEPARLASILRGVSA